MHDQSPNVNSIRHPKWGVPSAPSPRRGRIWCSERFETENDMKETASALETEQQRLAKMQLCNLKPCGVVHTTQSPQGACTVRCSAARDNRIKFERIRKHVYGRSYETNLQTCAESILQSDADSGVWISTTGAGDLGDRPQGPDGSPPNGVHERSPVPVVPQKMKSLFVN